MAQISVVVAAYNAGKFIRKNIESLLCQTFTDFELIYVDDGSKDDTQTIIREYAEKDDRIKVICQENQGAGAARNHGMDFATGQYLIVLDADDYYREDMLAVMLEKAETGNADLVICCGDQFDTVSGKVLGPFAFVREDLLHGKDIFSPRDIPHDIFQVTGAWAWNKLLRRKFIVENGIRFQNIPIIDDGFFSVMALGLSKRIAYTKERLTHYRANNPDSQMGHSQKGEKPILAKQFFEANRLMLEEFKRRNLYDVYARSLDEWVMLHFWVALEERCPDYATFQYTYDEVKRYMALLGTFERLSINGPEEYGHGYLFSKIKKMSADEFLFDWYCNTKRQDTSFRFLFPKERIKRTDRIILYGAGVVGRQYYAQNLLYSFCSIIGWADRDYKKLQEEGVDVISPEEISAREYDYVLIAIESQKTAMKIKRNLMNLSIPEEKIRWETP